MTLAARFATVTAEAVTGRYPHHRPHPAAGGVIALKWCGVLGNGPRELEPVQGSHEVEADLGLDRARSAPGGGWTARRYATGHHWPAWASTVIEAADGDVVLTCRIVGAGRKWAYVVPVARTAAELIADIAWHYDYNAAILIDRGRRSWWAAYWRGARALTCPTTGQMAYLAGDVIVRRDGEAIAWAIRDHDNQPVRVRRELGWTGLVAR